MPKLSTSLCTALWAIEGDAFDSALNVTVSDLVRDFNSSLENWSAHELGPYVARVRRSWRKLSPEHRSDAVAQWLTLWQSLTPDERKSAANGALTRTTQTLAVTGHKR